MGSWHCVLGGLLPQLGLEASRHALPASYPLHHFYSARSVQKHEGFSVFLSDIP